MSERIFQTLAQWLAEVPVVLASVIETRGATPRKRGSRMLIGHGRRAFSIGGGLAEASVIEAAETLLERSGDHANVAIDLSGKPGASGVCGGAMRIALRRWSGQPDRTRARHIAGELAKGRKTQLHATEFGGDRDETLLPNARLLIVGGGHCAAALCDLASFLDYDLWVHDERQAILDSPAFAVAQRISGAMNSLRQAFATERLLQVVLLNRDFVSDVAALRAIAGLKPDFIGMMGSKRRIAEVLTALPDQPDLASRLRAPIGVDIDAQTPHEIAISILAQLIAAKSPTC